MTDIFISYSKQDLEHTLSLAADLEARGYTTWWDSSMLPGEEFPDLIQRRIDEAKAVIVIWTANSVNSRWVRAEAHRADHQNKLITVYVPGLDSRDIPMPFEIRHRVPVTNREKIYAALHALKVMPAGGTVTVASASDAVERGVHHIEGNGSLLEGLQAPASFPNASAIKELGWMYREGRGVAQDDAEAARLFRKAAELGNASAIKELGWMYREGRGVAQDDAEAARLFRKAAELGNASAINELGWMYREGRGVAQDDAEAARLFRKAAELGNASAINELGWMYREGRGVAQDDAEAARLFRKAAELGNASI